MIATFWKAARAWGISHVVQQRYRPIEFCLRFRRAAYREINTRHFVAGVLSSDCRKTEDRSTAREENPFNRSKSHS
jgi:hypothetical protein